MSQHDLDIANQGFPATRADLNLALKALGSLQSGATAPSTTYANMLWYDTANNILKIRNEDNDAFISLFTLDQSADNIEALTINGTLTATGAFTSPGIDDNADATAITIDSSENVLVGTTDTSPWNNTSGTGILASSGGVLAATSMGDAAFYGNRLSSDGDIIQLRKDGTTLGSIGVSSGTKLYVGAGDSALRFDPDNNVIRPHNASTNGATDATLDIGNSSNRFKDLYLSGGVYLGGTGSANLLDSYEEGTFTASLGDDSTTAGSATGNYTKVGNQVFIKVSIGNVNTSSLTGSEDLRINGLPFTPVEVNFRGAGVASLDGVSFSGYITSEISGGAYIKLVENASGASGDRIIVSQYTSGSADIWISLVYTTNS